MALVAGAAHDGVVRGSVADVLGNLGLAADLDVVIGKLSQLAVIDAEDFLLFRNAEAENGKVVAKESQDAEDDACSAE